MVLLLLGMILMTTTTTNIDVDGAASAEDDTDENDGSKDDGVDYSDNDNWYQDHDNDGEKDDIDDHNDNDSDDYDNGHFDQCSFFVAVGCSVGREFLPIPVIPCQRQHRGGSDPSGTAKHLSGFEGVDGGKGQSHVCPV
jgi:hypothetical protein